MIEAIANPNGSGNYALLDLPVPLEPVIVDLDKPINEQLPPGLYLEAAKKMLGQENIVPLHGVKKVTVKFDAGIPPSVQGIVLLNLEKELRKLTGLDCRVYKDLMGDDSKLRVMMTQEQRDKL